MLWFCIYSFLELIFKNFMGDFYSFGTVGDGAGRIAQYAVLFVSNARLPYYLCLAGIPIYIVLHLCVKMKESKHPQLPLIVCIVSLLALMPCIDLGSKTSSILHVYGTFSNKDILVDKLGITHFFLRDITALGITIPDTIVVEEIDDEPEEIVPEKKTREIDDGDWKAALDNETNENVKTIDKFLMSRKVTQPNEMTGVFEDYNFIYVLVESFDYLAIDKDLTPTLYKMFKDGYTYYNHYTPLYSCATGESEFVSYVSLFPYVNVCTPNYLAEDVFNEALPFLFKNKGYDSFGIHNWRDEFYDRSTILKNMGIDEYYDIDDIWEDKSIVHTNGWQSDSMLMEQSIKHIEEMNGKFFAMIISSTMHFPYDESSYFGDLYIDEISKVHPDWTIDYKRYMSKCMDFDKGLEILLDYLEESGKADNTVICMYADHRPYWLDYDLVMSYTDDLCKREGENGIYRSPFIIYNKNLTPEINYNYCSTPDHVPTIANMFNLDYDPRLYIGKDIYDGDNEVIFTTGNWINKYGYYDVATDTFTPNKNAEEVSDEYVAKTTNNVANLMKISYMIMDETYFEKRRFICIPRIKRQ